MDDSGNLFSEDLWPALCGIPADAEYFDVSGFAGRPHGRQGGQLSDPFQKFRSQEKPLPRRGEQAVLAHFQLHPQYCGVLSCFAQYTDLYARDCAQVETPGFEWLILQNGRPVFPYTRLEAIVNPWAYNNYQIAIRLDENAHLEFVIRNRSIGDGDLDPANPEGYPIRAFGARLIGRYWYSAVFGSRVAVVQRRPGARGVMS